MKTLFWRLITLAIAVFALSTATYAAEGASSLEEAMEEMGGAFKQLSRAMRAPDAANVASYQEQVATIKKQATKAKDQIPALAEEAGEGKAAMVAAYKKSMDEFLAIVEKIEAALKEGDLVEAQAQIGKLNEARKQGHKDFQKPDED